MIARYEVQSSPSPDQWQYERADCGVTRDRDYAVACAKVIASRERFIGRSTPIRVVRLSLIGHDVKEVVWVSPLVTC